MDSNDLKIFQAVAREKSITGAAKQLGYVQSNVTARIQNMESELRVPLFYRQSRGVTLTSAGTHLLKYAEQILHLLEEAKVTTQHSELSCGYLRIGSLEMIASIFLADLLANYHRQYPRVQLSLKAALCSELTEQVLAFELDGAFVNGQPQHPDLETLLVFQEQLVLIASPSTVDVHDALTQSLLVTGRGCFYRDRLEQWLQAENLGSVSLMEFGTVEAIIRGVAAGLGVSLVTESAVKDWVGSRKIQCFPVPDRYHDSSVSFVYRRDLFQTDAFQRFVEGFEAHFA
ncbi:LysR family transcriptional regulator [Paenibacillus filicis]|uniref:LysR family transcriptional regulator n=1 Tax=Paenibacillus filicis TaxID=669464 RepID=A0ABU9DTU4_9BACL